MKLNLGCGNDYRENYINIDFNDNLRVDKLFDLSKTPWPIEDSSCDEILMLDFLEHFPYKKTDDLLHESWRVLREGGSVIVQVPDFEHCSNAIMDTHAFLCNVCGNSGKDYMIDTKGEKRCANCGTRTIDISRAAVHRLYGGQDYEGNFHFTAFTPRILEHILSNNGFHNFEYLEKHHQFQNWNFKVKATKKNEIW